MLKTKLRAVGTRVAVVGVSTLFAFVAFPLMVSLWSSCSAAYRDALWTEENMAESRRRGERIAAALDDCQVKTGRLPSRLDELVPAFLDRIPEPVAGSREWDYALTSDGSHYLLTFRQHRSSFELSFGGRRGERWSSVHREWIPFD
jgi:hypothetical protein